MPARRERPATRQEPRRDEPEHVDTQHRRGRDPRDFYNVMVKMTIHAASIGDADQRVNAK